MEEVWKDISLSSSLHPPCTHHTLRDLNLQDFLACPSTDLPTRDDSYEPSSARCGGATAFGRLARPPPTLLSLSSGSDEFFRGLERSDRTQFQSHANGGSPSFLYSLNSPLAALVNKRASESDEDRRRKRLIKNRESADRSRARKQAYTNELENEVARLLKENAKLRRKLEKFCSEDSSAQVPKKPILHRTLTAPF